MDFSNMPPPVDLGPQEVPVWDGVDRSSDPGMPQDFSSLPMGPGAGFLQAPGLDFNFGPPGPPPFGAGLPLGFEQLPPGPPPGMPPGFDIPVGMPADMLLQPPDVSAFLLPIPGLPMLDPGFDPSLGPQGPPLVDDLQDFVAPPIVDEAAGGGSGSNWHIPRRADGSDPFFRADRVPPVAAPAPKAAAPKPSGPSWLPSWVPSASVAESEESESKRRKLSGLASSKNIQTSGSVTIYTGYSAVTSTARAGAPAAQAHKDVAATKAQPASSSSLVTGTQALPRQLPEGWEMKKSRSSGKTYFVNEKLGKSQFDPPAGSTFQQTVQKKEKKSLRAKDGIDAIASDKNGVTGLVRATDQKGKMGRWNKWNKASAQINEASPERG